MFQIFCDISYETVVTLVVKIVTKSNDKYDKIRIIMEIKLFWSSKYYEYIALFCTSFISNQHSIIKVSLNIPSSIAITADIENGNYRCSSALDDTGKYRPDIAVLPGTIQKLN